MILEVYKNFNSNDRLHFLWDLVYFSFEGDKHFHSIKSVWSDDSDEYCCNNHIFILFVVIAWDVNIALWVYLCIMLFFLFVFHSNVSKAMINWDKQIASKDKNFSEFSVSFVKIDLSYFFTQQHLNKCL